MNMNECPQCHQPRKAEEYKCPKCDCYYSQLDEILAKEEAEREKKSFKGRFKTAKKSKGSKQAFSDEIDRLREETPLRTKFTLIVICLFVFALVISVM